jgi:ribosomal protein L44E
MSKNMNKRATKRKSVTENYILKFLTVSSVNRYDNVTRSPLLLPARVTNRSHSTYGSSTRSDSHRVVFCPNSVVSGWKN